MPVSLDYAPPSRSRRKLIRHGAIAVVVIALALSTWRWGPGVYQQASILFRQWKCMNHEAPADQVIYASGPNPTMLPADKVKTEGMPPPWYCGGPRKEVGWDFNMTAPDVAPVFSHQVRNNGQTRLICVLYCDYARVGQKSYRALSCRVVRPATWTTPQKGSVGTVHADRRSSREAHQSLRRSIRFGGCFAFHDQRPPRRRAVGARLLAAAG